MQPLKQGQLDGLCGIYAVINACEKLLGKPMDDDILQKLFISALKTIPQSKYPHVLWEGIETKDMIMIAKKVAKDIKKYTPVKISVGQPFVETQFDNARDFIDCISNKASEPVCKIRDGRFCG